MTIVANILLVAGLFFIVVSTYALFSMRDVYTRAHAVAKSETVGLILVFAGVFLRPEMNVNAYGRLAAVLIFALIANPTAVHALLRAAIRSGTEPWKVTGQAEADRELERYR